MFCISQKVGHSYFKVREYNIPIGSELHALQNLSERMCQGSKKISLRKVREARYSNFLSY